MGFDWRVDDTQMRALANQLMNEGEEQILRLFGCWCARQLPIFHDGWEERINIAEKYALGLIPEEEINRADQILTERQIQKLKKMVEDKWNMTE